MKIFNIFASILVAGTIFAVTGNMQAHAASIDTTPDCDNYSVMYCGAFSKHQIINKLENGDGHHSGKEIRDIYARFDLTKNRIQNDNFVDGVVYQNGNVKVGNKIVATNAKTYIRTMGKVSADKMGSAQAALVHLNQNGEFEYAVMTPCGNPVSGKAVPVPTPTPTPTPVPPTPVTPVAPEKTPEVLPNTGAGSVIGLMGLFSGTSVIGTLVYRFWAAKRLLG